MAGCAPLCLHQHDRDDADAVTCHAQHHAISHVALNALFQIATIKKRGTIEEKMYLNFDLEFDQS